MKKIINGKTYNTETARQIAEQGTGQTANFSDWYTELYVTKKGAFFTHSWGGAMTQFAENLGGGSRAEGSAWSIVTKEEALSFLDDAYNIDEEIVKELFEIEEG